MNWSRISGTRLELIFLRILFLSLSHTADSFCLRPTITLPSEAIFQHIKHSEFRNANEINASITWHWLWQNAFVQPLALNYTTEPAKSNGTNWKKYIRMQIVRIWSARTQVIKAECLSCVSYNDDNDNLCRCPTMEKCAKELDFLFISLSFSTHTQRLSHRLRLWNAFDRIMVAIKSKKKTVNWYERFVSVQYIFRLLPHSMASILLTFSVSA